VSESAPLLDKAERSLLAAEQLFAAGHFDFAASRAYYACFYVAEGLLLSQGLEFSRHGQVIAQYGYHFARTAVLDPAFHNLLIQGFSLRQVADYDDSTDLPESEVVLELIREGRRFLEAARRFLMSPPSEPAL
jgi:uncharacterized protein (UPF0332 family)